MKILVVSSRPPWPARTADAMTVERMIRFLAGRGHTVDLACFVEDAAADRRLREGIGSACRHIETQRLPWLRSYAQTALGLPGRFPMQVDYYRSGAMQAALARLVAGGGYDVVYTHLIRMAEYTRRLALPKALGVQISQALNLERMLEHARDPLRRLFYAIEARKVRPYEAAVCADFDRVFLCGPSDVAALERSAPVRNAVICPHGQDVPALERVRAAVREPGAIAVSGVMSTYTNVDAVCWFAKEVFPRVEAQVPDACFWIVGRDPQRAVRALARPPRVVVTGEVPDVSDWLCRARVGVAPTRIGAGMQNKLVQAMACELPVVATSVANEGIGAKPDLHLLLRDDPAAMAEAIVELLRDPVRARVLGEAARGFVEAHWTWEAHFERLEATLAGIAAG
jgi:glycosyltransferase involved in cell wall biosynthesis